MRKSDFQNMTPEQAAAAQRGYSTKAAKLPELKLGERLFKNSTDSWFKGIQGKAGQHFEDAALLEAKLAHRGMADGWHSLEQLRQNRNPNDTPAAHINKVVKATDALVSSVAKRNDRAIARINDRRAAIQREITERLGLDTHRPDAAEIRSVLRAMPDDKRNAAIMQAATNGDAAILSAIWQSESILTGIPGDRLDAIRNMAVKQHAGDLLELDAALNDSYDLLQKAFMDSLDLADTAAGGPDAARKFAADAEAADLAAAGFQAALNS
ncbi:MAG: hypothetical protein AB7U63_12180 [Porticoccaceae bacterium]